MMRKGQHRDMRPKALMRMSSQRHMGTSDEVFNHAKARRHRQALIVEGISAPDMKMIPPEEFGKLDIDERYQRVRVTQMVNLLIHVLRGEGEVFDPITLCQRQGVADTLFIVDGQQRFWAHNDCQKPIRALVYQSTGWEAEAKLFEAMNDRVIVNANVLVKGHQGPSAEMIRNYALMPGTPLYNNVDFGQGGKRPYSAFMVLKGISACASGTTPRGKAIDCCMSCDHALVNLADARKRAELFIDLFPIVFPPNLGAHVLPLVAFGRVIGERQRVGLPRPSPTSLMRLSRVNWPRETEGKHGMKYLPVLEQVIRQRLDRHAA